MKEKILLSKTGLGKDENQDAICCLEENNAIFVSISDGLGSSKYSKSGAEKAASVACLLLKKGTPSFRELIFEWRKSIDSNDLDDFDATIRFLAIDDNKIVVGGVGDGLTALLVDGLFYSIGKRGVFSNQTDSLNSPYGEENYWINEFPYHKEAVVILATDGFSEDLDENGIPNLLEDFFYGIFADKQKLENDLRSLLDNWPIKSNCDDKTIAITAIRRP